MAIVKRSSGTYQVKYRGNDGRWISETFPTKREAESFELELKKKKRSGSRITNSGQNLILDEYFALWAETVRGQSSSGWFKTRKQQYADFVKPLLGNHKLKTIQPPHIAAVLNRMNELGKAAQSRVHVYGLLHKMFRDADETFRLVSFNPVLRSFKPQIPVKEAPHLNLDQVRILLSCVRSRPYGRAVWLHFFLGLRVGELQALRWEDVDLGSGLVHIRRAYVRKERVFNEYPKGRKHHSKPIPGELFSVFSELKAESGNSDLVVTSPGYHMLSYEGYQRALVAYCKEFKVPRIGTHGLRHSTAALYLSSGASRHELRNLFAHSSEKVTERYIHHIDSGLDDVAKVIQLFPGTSQKECSQNVPKSIDNKTIA